MGVASLAARRTLRARHFFSRHKPPRVTLTFVLRKTHARDIERNKVARHEGTTRGEEERGEVVLEKGNSVSRS